MESMESKEANAIFDRAMKLLEENGISFRFNGVSLELPRLQEIQVLSEYTKDGIYGSVWITCPGTLRELIEWIIEASSKAQKAVNYINGDLAK